MTGLVLACRHHDQLRIKGATPGHVWTASLDASAKLRNLTVGSIAVMCPPCWCGDMAAGPDGIRDPAPNNRAAWRAAALAGFSGSSVRPIVISFGTFTLGDPRVGRLLPLGPLCPGRRGLA